MYSGRQCCNNDKKGGQLMMIAKMEDIKGQQQWKVLGNGDDDSKKFQMTSNNGEYRAITTIFI